MCVVRDGGWQCSVSERPLEETVVIEAVSVLEGLWQGWTPTFDSVAKPGSGLQLLFHYYDILLQ